MTFIEPMASLILETASSPFCITAFTSRSLSNYSCCSDDEFYVFIMFLNLFLASASNLENWFLL